MSVSFKFIIDCVSSFERALTDACLPVPTFAAWKIKQNMKHTHRFKSNELPRVLFNSCLSCSVQLAMQVDVPGARLTQADVELGCYLPLI